MTFDQERKWKIASLLAGSIVATFLASKFIRIMLERLPMFIWYWRTSPYFRAAVIHDMLHEHLWLWGLLIVGIVGDIFLLTFCLRRWSR
jgi:hypothetical protein